MIENTAAKAQKLSASEYDVLTDLLVSKDKEIKDTLKVRIKSALDLYWLIFILFANTLNLQVASTQAEVETKILALRAQVGKQDQDIQSLQKQLKEAEHILVCAMSTEKLQIHIDLFDFRRLRFSKPSRSCNP
jgi:mediator of RNA polymerase II transcription subunit 4